jgi:hypothetical protein
MDQASPRAEWKARLAAKTRRLCAMFCVLAATGCAAPEPGQNTTELVPLRSDCTAAEAMATKLEDFISRPDRYIGKCIRTRGFVAFRSVSPSLQSLYKS